MSYSKNRVPSCVFAFFFLLIALVPSGYTLASEITCAITPFSQAITAGEAAEYRATISHQSQTFEFSFGDFPQAVTGGFIVPTTDSTSTKIRFSTSPRGQSGSFTLTLFYRGVYSDGEAIAPCRMNLIISPQSNLDALSSLSTSTIYAVPLSTSQPRQTDLVGYNGGSSLSDAGERLVKTLRVKNGVVLLTANGSSLSSEHTKATDAFSFQRKLSRGMRGNEVKRLQQILGELGYFPNDISYSGFFGPITTSAVIAFQESRGIERIGIVGPKTRNALNTVLEYEDAERP